MLDVHPESYKKVDHHWRAHGDETDINKIFADGSGGYTHSFTNSCTYPKYMPFDKMFETVHTLN
jgi:hypothetical protein